jgi:hypothetical protein
MTSFPFQNPSYAESNGRMMMEEEEVVRTRKQPVLMPQYFEEIYKTTCKS